MEGERPVRERRGGSCAHTSGRLGEAHGVSERIADTGATDRPV